MDSDTTKAQQQLTCLFKRLFWFLPDEFHVSETVLRRLIRCEFQLLLNITYSF